MRKALILYRVRRPRRMIEFDADICGIVAAPHGGSDCLDFNVDPTPWQCPRRDLVAAGFIRDEDDIACGRQHENHDRH